MKIAVPVWQGTVSNVFDFARRMLLVEIEGGVEVSRSEVDFCAEAAAVRVSSLKQLGVNVLICGAISRSTAQMVRAAGIELLAYVTGDIKDILQGYKDGSLGNRHFALPGCWNGARRGFGRWQHNLNQQHNCSRQRCRRGKNR